MCVMAHFLHLANYFRFNSRGKLPHKKFFYIFIKSIFNRISFKVPGKSFIWMIIFKNKINPKGNYFPKMRLFVLEKPSSTVVEPKFYKIPAGIFQGFS